MVGAIHQGTFLWGGVEIRTNSLQSILWGIGLELKDGTQNLRRHEQQLPCVGEHRVVETVDSTTLSQIRCQTSGAYLPKLCAASTC
jgi:hypothetical protein